MKPTPGAAVTSASKKPATRACMSSRIASCIAVITATTCIPFPVPPRIAAGIAHPSVGAAAIPTYASPIASVDAAITTTSDRAWARVKTTLPMITPAPHEVSSAP